MVDKLGFQVADRLHLWHIDQVNQKHLQNVLFLEGLQLALDTFEVRFHVQRLYGQRATG